MKLPSPPKRFYLKFPNVGIQQSLLYSTHERWTKLPGSRSLLRYEQQYGGSFHLPFDYEVCTLRQDQLLNPLGIYLLTISIHNEYLENDHQKENASIFYQIHSTNWGLKGLTHGPNNSIILTVKKVLITANLFRAIGNISNFFNVIFFRSTVDDSSQ